MGQYLDVRTSRSLGTVDVKCVSVLRAGVHAIIGFTAAVFQDALTFTIRTFSRWRFFF